MDSVSERQPRDRFYDGKFYARFSDRQMAGLHARLAREAGEHNQVLDACCGTGGLTFRLAENCKKVFGIDLSPRNIQFAENRKRQVGADNIEFWVGDVGTVAARVKKPFDLVTVVMALHEMPAEARIPVLNELARVGRRIMVVDFNVPMPWNRAGIRNRFVEFSTGPEHFRAFRDYTRRGGLDVLVTSSDLECQKKDTLDRGTLTLQFLALP